MPELPKNKGNNILCAEPAFLAFSAAFIEGLYSD